MRTSGRRRSPLSKSGRAWWRIPLRSARTGIWRREAAPRGVAARIEDVALHPAFLFQTGTDAEDLADVARGGVERAVRCRQENGYLIDREGHERGIKRTRFDAVEVTLIAGTDEEM